ncbi:hypothetical protein [Flavonifractor sp. An82]|nr:hypothetical protein [Flavonifractor sp. An82]
MVTILLIMAGSSQMTRHSRGGVNAVDLPGGQKGGHAKGDVLVVEAAHR